MDGGEAVHGLQFDHEPLSYQKIQPRLPDALSFVLHSDRYLPVKLDVAKREFDTQRFFVYGFEETRSQNAMHLDGCPDDTVCKHIEVDAWLRSWPVLGDLGVLAVHSLSSTLAR
jgi:hypothetical protein